ncbi:lipopolysaccharide biosynthesis protein [Persicitalea jodogahamensis]|uniref:Polysaccharide biosynthesis protein n=1 Tax=Persicitalea jodogahamensis TaxID=402147 RepID=A0A8J3G7U7_9BACT|nr:oligosaccharide flippase family protein [Persicitalea jodogahamensis]GHB59203.1 hypothetical protein GCM10007390_11080 [Persicitalea jodogahamensis]
MLRWGFVNLLGQIVRVLTSLICIPVLITYMGLELYGLWSWSITILAVIQLSEGGLSAGLLYFYSKERASEKMFDAHLTSSLILLLGSTIIVCFVIFIFSPYLIDSISEVSINLREELSIVLNVGIVLVAQRIVQSLFWAILQAEGRYELYNLLNTTQIVATNFTWIGLAYANTKYLPHYIYGSLLISSIITVSLFLCTIQTFKRYRWVYEGPNLKLFFNYNLAAWGSSVGSAVFTQGDKLIVASILGPVTLGVYVVFTSICIQLNQIVAHVVHPLFPIVSSSYRESETDLSKVISSVSQMFLVNIHLALIGATTLIVFSEEILQYFLKQDFQPIFVSYFSILAGIYGIYSLAVTGYYILMGQGNSVKVMRVTIMSGIGVLASVYILGSYIGLLGVVLGNAVYLLILKLLYDGMKSIYGDMKSWIFYVAKPLILLSLFVVSVFLLDLTLVSKLILFSIISLFLIFTFIKNYRNI